MSRIATGMMIAGAALAINGGGVRQAAAHELHKAAIDAGRLSSALSTTDTTASGHRSERVLSLLIALEALRAAPEVLARRPADA